MRSRKSATPRIGISTRKIHAIRGLIVILIITEKMIISGVLIAARISIWYAFCTFVTSVVILVTSEEDEKFINICKCKNPEF